MLEQEEWRPIPSYPDYDASNLGRIRSRRRRNTRILSASPAGDRYLAVAIRRPGPCAKSSTRNVHSLVAEAFHGPRPAGLEVRHLNGQLFDNRASNLKYGTHAENLRDRVRHGTDPNASKTHCPQRHPYDESNTYWAKSGGRACRACNRNRQAALRAASVPSERVA